MSNPRTVTANFKFNGKWLGKSLKDYLQSVTYTDVASGQSDQLDIVLQNIGGKKIGKNKMYLESVSETWDEIWNKGELARATLSLTFSEYA